MHTLVNILAVVGALALCVAIAAAAGVVKSLEDGVETGGDHRTEEEREKDGSI